MGNKFGPIDLTLINIGAYNFYPMMPYKDKSAYHTNPEEALSIAQNLKSKKVIVDPKGDNFAKYTGSFFITPNTKESYKATHINPKNNNLAIKCGKYIIKNKW